MQNLFRYLGKMSSILLPLFGESLEFRAQSFRLSFQVTYRIRFSRERNLRVLGARVRARVRDRVAHAVGLLAGQSIVTLRSSSASAVGEPAAIPHRNNPQRALTKAAAQAMMETLPVYFEESRRSAAANEADWQKSRRRLESAARNVLTALEAQAGM
jgi:hypothetical protein